LKWGGLVLRLRLKILELLRTAGRLQERKLAIDEFMSQASVADIHRLLTLLQLECQEAVTVTDSSLQEHMVQTLGGLQSWLKDEPE